MAKPRKQKGVGGAGMHKGQARDRMRTRLKQLATKKARAEKRPRGSKEEKRIRTTYGAGTRYTHTETS